MILIFECSIRRALSSRREAAAGLVDGSERTGARVRQIAREVLGFAVLRPAQVEAVTALAAGRDCLAVLPSGAGNSAIYQIAAVAPRGPAVVVSPLLALTCGSSCTLRCPARWMSITRRPGVAGVTAGRLRRSAATGLRTWACSGPLPRACPITATWRPWPAR